MRSYSALQPEDLSVGRTGSFPVVHTIRSVGRIGALAAALGVGVMFAGVGVAAADPGVAGDSASSSASASESASESAQPAPDRSAGAQGSAGRRGPRRPQHDVASGGTGASAVADTDPRSVVGLGAGNTLAPVADPFVTSNKSDHAVAAKSVPAPAAAVATRPAAVLAPLADVAVGDVVGHLPGAPLASPLASLNMAQVISPQIAQFISPSIAQVMSHVMPQFGAGLPRSFGFPVASVAPVLAAAPGSLIDSLGGFLARLSGSGSGAPVESPAAWAALEAARRFTREIGLAPAGPSLTTGQLAPRPAATTGTTTAITWNYGTNSVLSFNPATDKLDFGWMTPADFDVTQNGGSTVIAVVGNNQSYTLQGVGLSRLSMNNIVASDSTTVTKWQNIIATAQGSATPTVSIANAAVAEGNSGSTNAGFTVSLSQASTSPVTVKYATANGTATAGSDYTANSGTLTFAAGVTSQTLNVAVTGDTTVEPTETFTVTLSTPSGATLGTATATGTITNDDTTSTLPIASQGKVLEAYFPEWGIYGRNFQVADVPADKLTHLIYAFADLTPAGDVVLYDKYAAVEKRFAAGETVSGEADLYYYPPEDPRSTQTIWGNFNQIAELKKKYPHLRVNIAVGGWTLSKNFSTVASTAAGREHMADSVVSFLTTYPMFDGVDFDWEYPGGGGLDGNSSSPNDGANYAELLKVVRTKLDALGQKTGRYYEITVASPAGSDKIANYNVAGLAPYVDRFNVMAYDFHGTWEKSTGHQSAFTGDPNGYDVQTAVNLYLKAGVTPSKIVLGAPLYTRGWSGVADGGDGGYAEVASGAAPGTFEAGSYDYKDLLKQLQDPSKGWVLYWDDKAQAAYLYNAAQKIFSSFETPTSIAQKSEWAQAMGLGGMMFWDITNDAVDSPESLVKAAYDSWVIHDSMATIHNRSTLIGERIIGGDGMITPLPATSTLA